MSSIWSALVGHGTFRFMTYLDTGLWADVRELPGALGATLDAAEGVAEAAALLRDGGVERIVATGNGAAYYVAHALWLAALEGARGRSRRSSPSRAASWCATASAGSRATRCWRCPRRASSATWSSSRSAAGARAWRSPRPPTPRSPRAATATVLQHVAGAARGDAHAGARGRVRVRARAVGGRDRRRGARGAARDRARGRGGRRRARPRRGRPRSATCTSRRPPSRPAAAPPGPPRWSSR